VSCARERWLPSSRGRRAARSAYGVTVSKHNLPDPELEARRRALYRPAVDGAEVDAFRALTEDRGSVVVNGGEADRERNVSSGSALQEEASSGRRLVARVAVTGSLSLVGVALVVAAFGYIFQQESVSSESVRQSSPTVSSPAAAAKDGGSRQYARGATETISAGVYAYRVAPSDTVTAIATRFRVCVDDVHQSKVSTFDWSVLQPGDVLRIQSHGHSC
jgi:hypothetical protein